MLTVLCSRIDERNIHYCRPRPPPPPAVHQVAFEEGLHTEHERYLAEQYCKGPVFVTDYPAAIKPFYMRQNDDGLTVSCTDLLVPRVVRERPIDRSALCGSAPLQAPS